MPATGIDEVIYINILFIYKILATWCQLLILVIIKSTFDYE